MIKFIDPRQNLEGGRGANLGNCLKNVKIIGFFTFSVIF